MQHMETNRIYIKKILDVYNMDVYSNLYANPIPGTPSIIEYCQEDKQLILIEEYISGTSLLDKINNNEINLNDAINYMIDICQIVEQFHMQTPPIIHRDIKPSNIIITSYNKAILLDFNAAKQYSETKENDTTLLGTVGYAAPEQYGFGASSPQTDIYSLGILLKDLVSCYDSYPEEFNSIIDKCTQMNPSERYLSVSDFKYALASCICKEQNTNSSEEVNNSNSVYNNRAVDNLKPSILPPGFRTRKPGKMILAIIGYALIISVSLDIQIDGTYGSQLWIERITMLCISLSAILIAFNYMNIHKILMLCQSRNLIIKILGIIILIAATTCILFITMFALEAILY